MFFSFKKIIFSFLLAVSFVTLAHAQSELDTPPASLPTAAPVDLDLEKLLSQEIPGDLESYQTGPTANEIIADMTPENPGAFESVNVILDSNLIDLRRYQISWYIDGKITVQGFGKTRLTTTTKNYGQTTKIEVVIAIPTGAITKTLMVTPQDVSTMWEAMDSYVPPFYEGKKLPARESIVKIVAIPNFIKNGRTVDPETLVYNWKRNDNIILDSSSYGASSILIQNNKLRASEVISVTASTADDSNNGTADQYITFFNPKILFYQKDPTTGITSPFARTFSNMRTAQLTVVAEPYFFSLSQKNPSALDFSWSVNNDPVSLSDTRNKQLLNLQNPGGSGNANLKLTITNPLTVYQKAVNSLRVNFVKP